MDVAYDHIQEEALSPDQKRAADSGPSQTQSNLNNEFSEAFKAVSASPWGAKLGGWFSQARKQGETFVQDLQKEATEASEQATKGFSSLREQVVQRTRGMTLDAEAVSEAQIPGEEAVPKITTAGAEKEVKDEAGATKAESLPADIVKEAGSLVASLRATAVSRLKDLQKAEDAADEALLKFGTNVRNFLRDAVIISAPDDDAIKPGSEVLFETQEPGTGKKIFHTTRLDAQLHAIHTTAGSFTEDPEGEEWKTWETNFDAEKNTDAIAADLEQYEELRRAMEKLVPEKVEYKTFLTRYYFLRKAVEEDEKKRKEVLRGATADTEEEVAWDDDDEVESSTPQPPHAINSKASESTTTLNASAADANAHLKPNEPRRSEDENKSVADSDASYDLVSGATSRAHGSPKEAAKKDDDSDDDWE
ncbi:hypothetical protein DOTSEDRAFT_68665 [Dothistroma septosporum NZE10]|uniref:BSD domain-containing protein n=1 Tax=Dothistroma septosporum (strain NZE10 / CBS 128990) TaxID=675120 RepID=N1Q2D7_DOTSN|nr:hypothetical protein DOTSEDRAFT_68665 [Dothistroma septosporum NZE10]